MTATVKKNIERILSWASKNAPQTVANLNKPATKSDLDAIESEFGRPVPDGFIELWNSFDGDGLGTWLAIFGNGNQMLSCKELLEHYRLDQEIGKSLYDPAMHKVAFWKSRIADHVIFVKGPVKPLMLHSKWLPFTSMNGDVIRYFDFDPAPGGAVGQVIQVDPEGCSYEVLADSLGAFLADYADQLESGSYSVAEDGFIESSLEPDPFEWGMPNWLKRASG
ncbi:MAG TPA: SMI1/KNR4 family protein [Gammaproteobacteria bacterium]|nr:SMI1/KNR4 family protein [Gammaproteobacteria bacterium]